jgi:hypothetical protein
MKRLMARMHLIGTPGGSWVSRAGHTFLDFLPDKILRLCYSDQREHATDDGGSQSAGAIVMAIIRGTLSILLNWLLGGMKTRTTVGMGISFQIFRTS